MTLRLLHESWQDFGFALRLLRRNSGSSVAIILSLALGIGASSAIFSILNALLLKDLPVRDPERLVRVTRQSAKDLAYDFTFPIYARLGGQARSFEGIAASYGLGLRAIVDGQAERVEGMLVSGNHFSVVGVTSAAGRLFIPTDDKVEGQGSTSCPVVISSRYWDRRFGRDMGAIGKEISLNGVAFTIVGVTPPGFFGIEVGRSPDCWVPVSQQPMLMNNRSWIAKDTLWWLQLIARMRPGVSIQAAQAELTSLFQQARVDMAGGRVDSNTIQEIQAETIQLQNSRRGISRLRKQMAEPVLILMGVVALVFLLTCANLANVIMARSLARQPEMAVRLAIGASRGRLFRQLLTESFSLAAFGVMAAIPIAIGTTQVMLQLALQSPGAWLNTRPDAIVFLFVGALGVLATLLLGTAPAWIVSGVNPAHQTRDVGGLWVAGRRLPLQRLLVCTQVAISIVLATTAALFLRSLWQLGSQPLGYKYEKLLLFRINPSEAGIQGPALRQFENRLSGELRQLPGVTSVTFSRNTPFTSQRIATGGIQVQGRPASPYDPKNLEISAVGCNYLETYGIALLRGRYFGQQDCDSSNMVAIINATMAERFFGSDDPVGRFLMFPPTSKPVPVEIIGVVKDAKYHDLKERTPPMIYTPYFQASADLWGPMTFALHTQIEPSSLSHPVRQTVAALSREIPVTDLRTLRMQIRETISQEWLLAITTTAFGLLALILAGVGLYGVVAYTVAMRTKEIGIRIALGAPPKSIVGMIVRETLLMTVMGIFVGLGLAAGAGKMISSLLFAVQPIDPIAFCGSSVILVLLAVCAACLPVIRAVRIAPVSALKFE